MLKIPFLTRNFIRTMLIINTRPDEFQTYSHHIRFLLEIEFTILSWEKKKVFFKVFFSVFEYLSTHAPHIHDLWGHPTSVPCVCPFSFKNSRHFLSAGWTLLFLTVIWMSSIIIFTVLPEPSSVTMSSRLPLKWNKSKMSAFTIPIDVI